MVRQMSSGTCMLYLSCENFEIEGLLFWKVIYNTC
jgi:hypothetical protein